ncbi:ATP-binding cassette domain-containing protein [Phytoactinopolyspora limicola]|uniref:ATP-binding cassette domain-containing protein n=1 Tax=Phytoactinopolyspora limicola TaxID=2715536 RepID=UPI00140A2D8A|nr:ATP-binding cassette domain-containing protein [Phytoactinopolyspora limicola]
MTEPITSAEPVPPPPVIEAAGLGLRTRAGWVYRNVEARIEARTVVAIFGSAGTGRSSLLLTLTGRMRPTAGTLVVCGLHLPAQAAHVRRRTSVARLGEHVRLDRTQLVGEAVSERRLLAPGPAAPAARFDAAAHIVGFRGRHHQQVGDLPAVEVTLLQLALAAVAAPEVIAIDDVENGLTPVEQDRVWVAISRLARSGPVVVGASTVPRVDVAGQRIDLRSTR